MIPFFLKTRVHFLLVILAFSSVGQVAAKEASTDDWHRRDAFANPDTLDEAVIKEWRGGQWNIGGVKGDFRFVVTEKSKGRQKLYLQWYLFNGELAYSMSVKELNIRPEYEIDIPECEDGENCKKLKVHATHYYEERTRVFRIHLDGLGSYHFTF